MEGESKDMGYPMPYQDYRTLEEAFLSGDVSLFNQLRAKHGFIPVTLRDCSPNLRAHNLVGINLANCELINVHFSNLNLTNAKLNHASLSKCWFDGAELSGASFIGANFGGKTTLRGVRAQGAIFDEARFQDTDFSDARLERCTFIKCLFWNAFVSEYATETSVKDSHFRHATFAFGPDSPRLERPLAELLSEAQRAPTTLKHEHTIEDRTDPHPPPSPAVSASLTPSDSNDQSNLVPSPTEGEPPMTQQAPSLPQQVADKAKHMFSIGLTEAEEGLFRATCETVVELGRDGLVKIIDEIAPLSPESREKLVTFLNTDTGKGVTGAVLSGIFASPLMSMIPGISPRAVEFIQDKMAAEIRKGTVFRPAAKTGIKLFLMGPLKGVIDAVTSFTSIVERRMSANEQQGELKGLEQPRQVFDAFNGPAAAVATSPGTNDQSNK